MTCVDQDLNLPGLAVTCVDAPCPASAVPRQGDSLTERGRQGVRDRDSDSKRARERHGGRDRQRDGHNEVSDAFSNGDQDIAVSSIKTTKRDSFVSYPACLLIYPEKSEHGLSK